MTSSTGSSATESSATESSAFQSSALVSLSNQLAEAIAQAGQAIVAIAAGRRFSTSGIHWRQGIVVTTEHAVGQDDEVEINLPDQTTMKATLVGRDAGTDLAVLRLPETSLPTPHTSHAPLKVGHIVVAVGRSDQGLSASMGMISVLGGSWRSWHGGQIDQWIRPDLRLYRGLSGSALVDTQGAIVGINTSGPRNSVLTIPVSTVDRVVDQLLQRGRIVRGYLGIGMQSVHLPATLKQSLNVSHDSAVMVISTEPGSPADQAGVLMGDVIVALGDRPITEIRDLHAVLEPEQVGKPLNVTIVRAGALISLTLTIGERPRRAD